MSAHFSEAAFKFLRGLKKNNDRDWFDARKDIYEAQLKAPMLEVIEAVNNGLADFAPQHVRPPQKIMMRIYRDIRFSKNKQPYKTNLAAWWARQGLEKTSGAGFYFQFSPDELIVAGGAYMPEKDQCARHPTLPAGAPRAVPEDHDRQKDAHPHDRVRAGKDDPRTEGLSARQPGHGPDSASASGASRRSCRSRPRSGAGLVKTLVERMKVASPLVEFLNTPLVSVGNDRKVLF